jgi:hypothetical protein
MTTELVTRDGRSATLFEGASPAAMVEAATEAANALHGVIDQKNLAVLIGESEHVRVEGWQTCGSLVGVFAVKDGGVTQLAWPTEIPTVLPEAPSRELRLLIDARSRGLAYGFTASYKAMRNGREVGWGEGRVTRSESNWIKKEDHALASMAQTRGQSRALRQPLGFIVTLAGYSATPAEEMDGASAGAPIEVPVLSDADLRELVGALGQVSSDEDAYKFTEALVERLGGSIPEAVGVALRAWLWWTTKGPPTEAAAPETAGDEPTEAESPVEPETVAAEPEVADAEVVEAEPADADFEWNGDGDE